MSIIVKEGAFVAEHIEENLLIEVASDANPYDLLDQSATAKGYCILFPSSADGRGFSIASVLRQNGFKGHLRAKGHVLADQYPLAVRNGFDDVEISDELAARQPEEQWAEAFSRAQHVYRESLMASRNAA